MAKKQDRVSKEESIQPVVTPADDGGKGSLRGRVKSDFPKHTLEDALRIARVIEDEKGGMPQPPIDVAMALKMSPGYSEFRLLLSSSVRYGLTRGTHAKKRVAIESLGEQIVRPKSETEMKQALVTAALKPPKFRAIYEHYKGKKLPDPQFFANTLVREFQVPREHAEKCVDIFVGNVTMVGLVREVSGGRWLVAVDDSVEASGGAAGMRETHTPLGQESVSTVDSRDGQRTTPGGEASDSQVEAAPKNAIFIGHGKNHVPLDQLKKLLDQYHIPYKMATEEPNKFRPISEKVADTMRECGACILIFTTDEELKDKDGETIWRPSENVVYELGAASVLYGKRIIVFKEEAVHFPSNFRDIGHISFEKDRLDAKMNELFGELIAFGLIKITVGG